MSLCRRTGTRDDVTHVTYTAARAHIYNLQTIPGKLRTRTRWPRPVRDVTLHTRQASTCCVLIRAAVRTSEHTNTTRVNN